jgi:hypothetical protein
LDLKVIVDNLQRLSQYIPDFPQIEEFDTNPQMVSEERESSRRIYMQVSLRGIVRHYHKLDIV